MAPVPIAPGKIVGIYYTLKDKAGAVVDTNRKGGKPLVFLHGGGSILPALEAALVGKKKDDEVSVQLSAEQGYGPSKPELVKRLPRSAFPKGRELAVGMHFTNQEGGKSTPVTITGFEGDLVLVDQNHPLAGQELFFQVTIAGVRDASAEEREHGHAHGAGGHHH
ncbi:MAG TPA: peptidylprolyl isomerase [Planctomycetota bacterium]|nr:peptidylprolyl isomerase [Planctomycetota bacterium]